MDSIETFSIVSTASLLSCLLEKPTPRRPETVLFSDGLNRDPFERSYFPMDSIETLSIVSTDSLLSCLLEKPTPRRPETVLFSDGLNRDPFHRVYCFFAIMSIRKAYSEET